MMSRFPAAFRLPTFASRVILSRPEIGPSSRSAYRTARSGPGRGFHVPHTRDPTGVGASYAPRTAVLTRPSTPLRPAPAASQRPVPKPCSRIPSRKDMDNEVSTEVHDIHPSGLPLTCGSRMEREPSGFPPSFRPRRYQRRPSGWGQALSTGPELRCRHHRSTLLSSSSLAVCDLMSHV